MGVLRGISLERCPRTVEYKDKVLVCGGKMYVEQDQLLGETLTCMDCGYMTAPGYAEANRSKLRQATHNGLKLN